MSDGLLSPTSNRYGTLVVIPLARLRWQYEVVEFTPSLVNGSPRSRQLATSTHRLPSGAALLLRSSHSARASPLLRSTVGCFRSRASRSNPKVARAGRTCGAQSHSTAEIFKGHAAARRHCAGRTP